MLRSMFAIVVLFVFTLTVQTQAGVVPALDADFNTDIVGQAPDYSLPGDPVGDRISSGGTNVISVVSGAGEMTDQPLKITRTGSGGITQFKLVPELRTCESYVLKWTAMMESSQASTTFTIRDTGSGTKAVMGFWGSQLWTGLPYSTIFPDVGYSSPVGHAFTFKLTMNVTAGSYSLSLNGTPVPEMQDYPLYGGDFDRMEVAFGGAGGDYIFIDDISVMADCSFVATEKTSWGALKSYYR